MDEGASRTEAAGPRRRRQTVLDWTSDLDANEREELRTLRAAMGEHDGEIAALKAEAAELRRRLNDSTAALRLLERSRPWQRPAVWREIRCRGLLSA
jgi:chromosome segregation ATPase